MQIFFNNFLAINNVQSFQKIRENNKVSIPLLKSDTVSFSGNIKKEKIDVDKKIANDMAISLSTSTAGIRDVYGSKMLNPKTIQLLAASVGEYLKSEVHNKHRNPKVIIGGDTRVATEESKPIIRDILLKQGIDVMYIDEAIPTPVLSVLAQENDIDLVVLLTASHNPWRDGGFNLITSEGAIAPVTLTKKIAEKIQSISKNGFYTVDSTKTGKLENIEPYETYKAAINDLGVIDWDNIRNAGISIYYDPMQGSGKNLFPKLLDDYGIEYSMIESSGQEGPHPTSENLAELESVVMSDKSAKKIGLSNDGDADRLGIIDENGNYVSPNDILLLAAYHLHTNKGLSGKIIRSQSTASHIDVFANSNNLLVVETPVGFKYLGAEIIKARKEGSDMLVAGEESGGFTMHGHVLEKDGISGLLLVLDLMATENKPLSQILEDVKRENAIYGHVYDAFSEKFEENSDKEIIMNKMQEIYEAALNGETTLGDFEIDVEKTTQNLENMDRQREGGDGIKLFFTDGTSVLVRKSGTEPKVRGAIESYADDTEIAKEKVATARMELEKIFALAH